MCVAVCECNQTHLILGIYRAKIQLHQEFLKWDTFGYFGGSRIGLGIGSGSDEVSDWLYLWGVCVFVFVCRGIADCAFLN